jgi:3-deoxy-7-phosphoheptulonate synthase
VSDLPSHDVISWPDLPAAHQPLWPDADELAEVTQALATVPPLVFAGECDQLTEDLGSAARGEAFVLMGGDCA